MPDDGSKCMVFAEQRILGMCAATAGLQVKTFLEYGKLLERQELMTHLWSAKRLLHWNVEAESKYNDLCRKRLMQFDERSVSYE